MQAAGLAQEYGLGTCVSRRPIGLADARVPGTDEIGYLPLDDLGATILFQLVSARYERGSIILTSNKKLRGLGSIFGDSIIATAILDRLVHHSTTIDIRGESCRLKDRRKARPDTASKMGRDGGRGWFLGLGLNGKRVAEAVLASNAHATSKSPSARRREVREML